MDRSNLIYVGFALFMVGTIVARMFSTKAIQLLTPDQKAIMVDRLTKNAIARLLPIMLILLFQMAMIKAFPEQARMVTLTTFALILISVVALAFLYLKSIKALNFGPQPEKFLFLSRLVQLACVALFVVLMAISVW